MDKTATTDPTPIDPADALSQTASNFYDAADTLRTSSIGLPDHDADLIIAKAHELKEAGDHFTALAMGAILDSIKPDLDQVTQVTADANKQIANLTTVDDIIQAATLMLAVATAVVSEDPAAIITAVEALGDGLTGTTPQPSASSSSSTSSSSSSSTTAS